MDQRTRIVAAVIKSVKLPPRFRLRLLKEDPVRLELSLTPAYGKDPIQVGLVESLDLVARRDREGRIPRDLQGTWDWTVRHGDVSTGGWNPYLKEALQTMFETGLPAIVYEELTGRNTTQLMEHVTFADTSFGEVVKHCKQGVRILPELS